MSSTESGENSLQMYKKSHRRLRCEHRQTTLFPGAHSATFLNQEVNVCKYVMSSLSYLFNLFLRGACYSKMYKMKDFFFIRSIIFEIGKCSRRIFKFAPFICVCDFLFLEVRTENKRIVFLSSSFSNELF